MKKVTPLFQQLPLKVAVLSSLLPFLKNVVGGSTPPAEKKGVRIMVKLQLKNWIPKKKKKYSSVHRFEILPIFWGPDTVVNLFKLT